MNKSPNDSLVTIVIPCFNLGKYLREAIDSVHAQTYKNWEIIVVDDGSTDLETKAIINNLAKHTVKTYVLKQNNVGLSQTRNNGIAMAKGEYVVCLDADDKLEPSYLEKCLNVFDGTKNDKIVIVSTWLQEFGQRHDIWKPVDFSVVDMLSTNRLHAASMFKRELWEEVGGYKPEMNKGYEDWEFWLSAVEHGYEWQVIPEPLFNYRIREGSMLSGSKKTHDESYAKICEFHEKLFNDNSIDFAKSVSHDQRILTDCLNEQKQRAEQSIEESRKKDEIILELQANLFKNNQELAELKGSRLLSKAIYIRKIIGAFRHMIVDYTQALLSLPRRIIHKIRVVLSPFIPKRIRLLTKQAYRYIYGKIMPRPHYIPVANIKVKSGTPMVSVVIPYYNAADTIDETLESLRYQTFKDVEVIIVNDGSTDDVSNQKFDQLQPRGLTMKLQSQDNQGVAVARNNGIKEARGKYLMCLDSDDKLAETFIEKAVIYLETHPNCDLVNYYADFFGVESRIETKIEYDPQVLFENNMVITAAMYRIEAWSAVGGYKANIGYEDWEYWINLARHGYWGKTIPEALFKYRTSVKSRYTEDKMVQGDNIRRIHLLHPNYKKAIRRLITKKRYNIKTLERSSSYVNLKNANLYNKHANQRPNVLLALPWMTFGGAETLIYNFCSELKAKYNISFITGLKSENEWEWKFSEISPYIYHLANIFEDDMMYMDFISNYITTRNIEVLHIVHTSFMFPLLQGLKELHPNLKIIVTLFNDRAEHFNLAIDSYRYIDVFSTDNNLVAKHYKKALKQNHKPVVRIANGIDCYSNYNPKLYDREKQRRLLGLESDEKAVFFIGRLSEEKNPDIFIEVAKRFIEKGQRNLKVKFFVIGDGIMRDMVEKKIRHINSERIIYLGYQAKIAPFLCSADIFVLPSSVEGFPLSILEAMAMNVAVISSRVGAVPDIIEDGKNGMIVTPGSTTEIEERIETLLNDDMLLNRIKMESRLAVEEVYSSKILGENYDQMYREALDK
jgi:glycosyltransferase involved in cell wall biosynthesis